MQLDTRLNGTSLLAGLVRDLLHATVREQRVSKHEAWIGWPVDDTSHEQDDFQYEKMLCHSATHKYPYGDVANSIVSDTRFQLPFFIILFLLRLCLGHVQRMQS